jgi:hypothetical protein
MSDRTIYKYVLKLEERQTLSLPLEHKFLDAQLQHGQITLWYEVVLGDGHVPVGHYIVGTGNTIPEGVNRYLATVQKDGFVWHVYRR